MGIIMKYFISFLFMFSINSFAASYSQPKEETNFVDINRFEVVIMSGYIDRLITDKKTGCQYLIIQNEIAQLGCFEEYKKGNK